MQIIILQPVVHDGSVISSYLDLSPVFRRFEYTFLTSSWEFASRTPEGMALAACPFQVVVSQSHQQGAHAVSQYTQAISKVLIYLHRR